MKKTTASKPQQAKQPTLLTEEALEAATGGCPCGSPLVYDKSLNTFVHKKCGC